MLKNSYSLLVGFFVSIVMVGVVAADNHQHNDHWRADAQAPIGVMGDHMISKGKWMLSYRFMNMHMDGMRLGESDISTEQVGLANNPLIGEPMRMGNMPNGDPRIMNVPPTFRIVPLEMDMRMHMFGFMYGVSRDITAMVMVNYIEKEMTSQTYRGMAGTTDNGTFKGKVSGLGDTKVSALINMKNEGNHHFHWNIGLSLPTGSITETGKVLPPFAGSMIPEGEKVDIDRLGYNMQLGSGTIDFLPGITYTGSSDHLAWGGQLSTTLRFYDNKEGYRLGNVIEGTAWVSKLWKPWISTSLRLSAKSESDIKGRDTVITGGSPVFYAGYTGRDDVDIFLGINLAGQEGWVKGQRLAIEFGMPVYESVEGIQMSKDWSGTLAYKVMF